MIYHAFRKLNVGDIINLDHSPYEVVDVKEFGTVKTQILYEYILKEVSNENQNKK